jgi:hypothetical protein
MQLPNFLARPIFHLIFPLINITQRGPFPPLIRAVRPMDETRRQAFDYLLDAAFTQGPNEFIPYNLPYPKAEFLCYACDWRGLVAHGSPMDDLATIEPIRKSTDSGEFGNRQQIFCSPDAIWAMWFAILDKSKYRSTRNGCIRAGTGAGRLKGYFFQLRAVDQTDPPFTTGTIYFCRAEEFPYRHEIAPLAFLNAEVEEWGSTQPVKPLAKIRLEPDEFPYLNKVQYCL